MQQLILTIIFYVLIIAIVIFVYLIWRSGVKRTQKLEQTLIDVALKSAETSRQLSHILAEKEKPP